MGNGPDSCIGEELPLTDYSYTEEEHNEEHSDPNSLAQRLIRRLAASIAPATATPQPVRVSILTQMCDQVIQLSEYPERTMAFQMREDVTKMNELLESMGGQLLA